MRPHMLAHAVDVVCSVVNTTIRCGGAVAAVPKLLIDDAQGRRANVLYGAPPNLHQQIEAAVKTAAGAR